MGERKKIYFLKYESVKKNVINYNDNHKTT